MSRLLPFKSESASPSGDARVLDLGDDASSEALSALSSETARKILAAVYEEARTPPEIRDEVGTSLQNVHYHIENLEEANLIEPGGTGYSEKGTEMTVYAPANEAVVLFAGRDHDRSRLKTALSRLLGAVGLLAVASVAVRRFVETFGPGAEEAGDSLTGTPTDPGGGAPTEGTGAATPTGGVPDTPAPTRTPPYGRTDAPTRADTSTPDPDLTPTETPVRTSSGTPEATGTATETPLGTPTAEPTGTPTAEPAGTPTETATATPIETDTPEVVETATQTPTVDPETVETAGRATESGSDGLLADPAVAFFLGGAFVLVLVGVWWYLNG